MFGPNVVLRLASRSRVRCPGYSLSKSFAAAGYDTPFHGCVREGLHPSPPLTWGPRHEGHPTSESELDEIAAAEATTAAAPRAKLATSRWPSKRLTAGARSDSFRIVSGYGWPWKLASGLIGRPNAPAKRGFFSGFRVSGSRHASRNCLISARATHVTRVEIAQLAPWAAAGLVLLRLRLRHGAPMCPSL